MTLYKNPQIKDFILDFNLRRPDGVISFNASVSFEFDDHVINKIIEVQIVMSTSTETIYFLEPEIISPQMPDMLEAKLHEIKYSKGEMLIMKGNNSQGAYGITIKPVI